MLGFWLAAAGMTIVAVGFVLARLVFPRRAAVHAGPREANLAALKAAWAELDRDRANGILPEDQYESARAELARRAAEELDEPSAAFSPARPAWVAAALAAVLIPAAAFAFYGAVGNPSAVAEARAFAKIEGPLTHEKLPLLREQLAQRVAEDPKDGRAWALLGRVSLAMDRFAEAEAAFAKAVQDRKVMLDPAVWCDYADAAGLVQGGRLEGKPAELVAKALSIEPLHPRALEMAGSVAAEKRDWVVAARHWKLLLAQMDESAPERAQLSRAIEKLDRLAAGS